MNVFHISAETKKKLFAAFGVDPLRKADPAADPKTESQERELHKSLYDYGNAWYESYRGTPFFKEAVGLEQKHMLHEVERKQKTKAREAARRERDMAADKEESVRAWDDKFYATHDAKVADLKRRHLDWIAASTGEDGFQKPITKGNPTDDEHGASASSHSVAVTKSVGAGTTTDVMSENKEKSMSEVEVFEQIMKGAILKSAGSTDEGAAERLGAVELKRAIAKEEMTYAKCLVRAADAEAMIADLKKGLPPWLKDKKKDGDKDDDDDDGKGDDKKDGKKPPFGKGVGLPRQAGMGASKRGDDDVDEAMDDDAKKSLVAIGRAGGAAGLQKAIDEAFQRASASKERIRDLSKALSTVEHGEAGQAGASRIGASQTSAELGGSGGAGDTSNAEPFGSLGSMNGMPSGADPGQDTKLSEDDRDVGSQMSDGQSALESTMQHGTSDLNSSVGQVMGGDISHGSGMAKGLGASTSGRMGALGGGAQQTMSAANAQHAASLGYGIAPPAPAPTDRSRGREWAQGMVHYSTNEDARVADLMSKSSSGGAAGQGGSVYGGATGEPTLDLRAPLLKSMTCALCKSSVPAMYARCPACGNDHASGTGGAHMSGQGGGVSGALLSKSVKESLRGPVDAPCNLPNGVLTLD
jgi:hypothetical protein